MKSQAHTLPRNSGHEEERAAEGHAMGSLTRTLPRMLPHYVAILAVTEKVCQLSRKAVPIRHSRHFLGNHNGSWFAECFCQVEIRTA